MGRKIDELLSDFFKKYTDTSPSRDNLDSLKKQSVDNLDGFLKNLYLEYAGEKLSEIKLNHIKQTYGLINRVEDNDPMFNALLSVLTILFFILLLFAFFEQLIRPFFL
tara:strand:- start:42 stop:365 length:324 start_codon:yes stop_codon:yes gene_type:complete